MTGDALYDVRRFAGGAQYDSLVEVGSSSIWWQQEGPLAGLHLINELRVPYFERALEGYAGKRILDVGCGGGVFAEALAGAGAQVVGVDPSSRSIEVARDHADSHGLEIDYRVARAEEFVTHERFDAVMAVDVLEHVDDLDATLDTCARVLKPGSAFGFLTHNQTVAAFTALIWNAEYVHGRMAKGTHDFHRFITPDELSARLEARGMRVVELRGIALNQVGSWEFADTLDITYIGYAVKRP